jgi:hypothetical protein
MQFSISLFVQYNDYNRCESIWSLFIRGSIPEFFSGNVLNASNLTVTMTAMLLPSCNGSVVLIDWNIMQVAMCDSGRSYHSFPKFAMRSPNSITLGSRVIPVLDYIEHLFVDLGCYGKRHPLDISFSSMWSFQRCYWRNAIKYLTSQCATALTEDTSCIS